VNTSPEMFKLIFLLKYLDEFHDEKSIGVLPEGSEGSAPREERALALEPLGEGVGEIPESFSRADPTTRPKKYYSNQGTLKGEVSQYS